MNDLISRQDVLDVLRNFAFDHIFQCGEYYGEDERQLTIINARKAIDVIETMPSIEPEPEWKKGKWIDTGWKVIYKCSNCGNFLDFSGVDAGRGDANYCPNCGARMELE